MFDSTDLWEDEMLEAYENYRATVEEDDCMSYRAFTSMKLRELEEELLYTYEEFYAC